MPPMSRLFFALWPDETVRQRIEQIPLPKLKRRTTPRENWHMTLLFLGETSTQQQQDFERVASRVRVEPFTLRLDTRGGFARARVAWLGCQQSHRGLLELQSGLEAGMREVCPEHSAFVLERRPFRPHLTLYRGVVCPWEGGLIEPVSWSVYSFSLIESRRSGRPVYRVLNSWPLGA